MPREEDNDRETFASPACSMHEFADELVPAQRDAARTAGAPELADVPVLARTADGGEPSWPVIKPWRARTRAVLLSRRAAVELRERQRRGESAKQRLLAEVDLAPHRVLGFYWPIRAEIDARDIATRHIEAGGIAALPVITRKNAPVESLDAGHEHAPRVLEHPGSDDWRARPAQRYRSFRSSASTRRAFGSATAAATATARSPRSLPFRCASASASPTRRSRRSILSRTTYR